MRDEDRVVITGLAPIAPNGSDTITFWESLVKGVSPIKKIERFADPKLGFDSHIGAAFDHFTPEPFISEKEARRIGRCATFAAVGAKKVLADAHFIIDDRTKNHVGVIIGTGIGGVEIFEQQQQDFLEGGIKKIYPFAAASISPHAATSEVSILVGAHGPNLTVATGCSSGLNAIINAYYLIKQGAASWMIAGGTEAPLSPLTFATFDSSHQLSNSNDKPEEACKPFDLNRNGFVLAEGAGIVFMERLDLAKQRGAHIYGEMIGCASMGDAYHFFKLDEDGSTTADAMAKALASAQLAPEEIDWICSHGSGSKGADIKETIAIKKVFGAYSKKIPISSIKGTMGMPFGASGAFQVITSCMAFEHKMIPFIRNYKTSDPLCDLDYVVKESRSYEAGTAMINSFGLGGNNAIVILKKYSA